MDLDIQLNRLIEEIQSGRYTPCQIEDLKQKFLDFVESKIEDSYSDGYDRAEGDFSEGRS